jgi:hypothetical protein
MDKNDIGFSYIINLYRGMKMKKIRIILIFFAIIFIFFLKNKVYAAEESTKLMYQDIWINEDGSIKVREVSWLNRFI